jgi:hypothetical protein
VSLALKRAKDRIDTFIYKTMITAKNPAGAIFYAKAALGYRETDPADSAAQMQLPAKITINIMAAPQQPVETIECKDYKVIEPLK